MLKILIFPTDSSVTYPVNFTTTHSSSSTTFQRIRNTQKLVVQEMLDHIDELEKHIKNLSNEIDNSMNSDEKKFVDAISEIPGIGKESAEVIISVIGTDMDRFPTDNHISSWAGLAPGNNESAKKQLQNTVNMT